MVDAEEQTEDGTDGDGEENGRLQNAVEFVFDILELLFDLA